MNLNLDFNKIKYDQFDDEASPKENTKEEMEKQQNVFVVEHNKENMHKQRRSSKPEFLDARINKNEEGDDNDLSSVISLTTSSTDRDKEKIYRVFLICWFLHSVLGVITLIADYNDKENNSFAYYFVFLMTFKWIISAIVTFLIAFGIYVFCKLFLKDKNFGEYIGAIYMLFSGISTGIIVLAIPFGFRAVYVSNQLQFMTLLFIQIEIILDVIVISEVIWTLFFSSNSKSKYNLFQNEEEKGIKSVLSDRNLERLQKEIVDAYKKNEILKFDKTQSNQESTPERTYTENEEKREDRLSAFPISELEGEQNLSFEQGSTIRNKSRASSKNTGIFRQNKGKDNLDQSKSIIKYQTELKIPEQKEEDMEDERELRTISIKEDA